jgi:hypothetical protein
MNFERSLIERISPQQPPFDLGYSQPFWQPDKSSEPAAATTKMEANSGTDTDATPVVTPPTRDMRAVARQILAPASEALEKYVDDGPERSAMLGEVLSLIEKLGDVLTRGRQQRIDRLSAEQVALAEQCRQQAAVYATADKAVTDYLAVKRARHAELLNAESQLSSWEAQRDSLGRWPTGAALREYEVKRVTLVKAIDAAREVWEATFAEERRLISIRTAEESKLKKMAQAESTLIQRLSGKTWVDPELALPHEAEL